jgi:hypothetical protein
MGEGAGQSASETAAVRHAQYGLNCECIEAAANIRTEFKQRSTQTNTLWTTNKQTTQFAEYRAGGEEGNGKESEGHVVC